MALNWADKRRFMLLGMAALVLLLAVAGVLIAVMYETPSCSDGKQNQDERGIDCDGSCTYLCTADVEEPRVNFVRPLQNASGRADLVAYVENRNDAAEAKDARYTVELRDSDNVLLAQKEGSMALPARSIIPVFIPGLYQGPSIAARAFLTFEKPLGFSKATAARDVPHVGGTELSTGDHPRLVATLKNVSARSLLNVRVIATVFGMDGTAIGASQTLVREIPPQGTSEAVFTWNEPFPAAVARIEVLPVLELP